MRGHLGLGLRRRHQHFRPIAPVGISIARLQSVLRARIRSSTPVLSRVISAVIIRPGQRARRTGGRMEGNARGITSAARGRSRGNAEA